MSSSAIKVSSEDYYDQQHKVPDLRVLPAPSENETANISPEELFVRFYPDDFLSQLGKEFKLPILPGKLEDIAGGLMPNATHISYSIYAGDKEVGTISIIQYPLQSHAMISYDGKHPLCPGMDITARVFHEGRSFQREDNHKDIDFFKSSSP